MKYGTINKNKKMESQSWFKFSYKFPVKELANLNQLVFFYGKKIYKLKDGNVDKIHL